MTDNGAVPITRNVALAVYWAEAAFTGIVVSLLRPYDLLPVGVALALGTVAIVWRHRVLRKVQFSWEEAAWIAIFFALLLGTNQLIRGALI